MLPKVSIVIPVFNGANFLDDAINSALSQSYPNIEIIVVNDGSTDGGATEQIALAYGEQIRYFSKPNGGVASALNFAITKMTGEYFSWLSHDDLYYPNKIESEIEALAKLGRDDIIIYSDYSIFTNNPAETIPVHLVGIRPEHFRYWITIENLLHGCTLLIPKFVFERVGYFNENLRNTQDYDLWFRMAKEYDFFHLPKILVNYRSHPDQDSHKHRNAALKECNDLLSSFIHNLSHEDIQDFSPNKPLMESYTEIACSMFSRGFNQAGVTAENYARLNDKDLNPIINSIYRYAKYSRCRIFFILKKIMPLTAKQTIKKAIHFIRNVNVAATIKPNESLKSKFSKIYAKNSFAGRASRSGGGSDLAQTSVIRHELPNILKYLAVQSMLDAPCGDWYWMKHTDIGKIRYIGIDIVDDLITNNKNKYGNDTRTFLCLNLVTDALPTVDLILSRDCLVHLSFSDALKVIKKFKQSGSTYLLTTTFNNINSNKELNGIHKFWRPLNMCLEPFYFPTPIMLLNEGCTEEGGQFSDKCLGLWLLNEIQPDLF